MNGWERLGVVVGLVVAVPAAAIAWDANDHVYSSIVPDDTTSALKGQAFWDALYRQAQADRPDTFGSCNPRTVKMSSPTYVTDRSYTISCKNVTNKPFGLALLWFIIPFAVLWGIGGTVRWVRDGFRSKT